MSEDNFNNDGIVHGLDLDYLNEQMTTDFDKYKPSHEQIPEAQKEFAAMRATSQKIKEAKDAILDVESSQSNRRFIDRFLFVPLDLEAPISGKTSRSVNYTTILIIITATIFVFLGIVLTGKLSHALSIHPLFVMIGLFIIWAMLTGWLFAKFIYRIEDKKQERYVEGTNNKNIILGSLWSIPPGGITETKGYNGLQTNIRYNSKESIIIKLIKDSIYVENETADFATYAALRDIEDLLSRENYLLTKINQKYNIDNDYIWDKLNNNLVENSIKGGKVYTDVMSDILSYHYGLTKLNTSLSVTYYIISPRVLRPAVSEDIIVSQIFNILKGTRIHAENVSNHEFIGLLRDYYGVSYLDIEKINEYLSKDTKDAEVHIISYMNTSGEIVKLAELPNIKINIPYDILEEPMETIDTDMVIKDIKRQTIYKDGVI